MESIGSYSRGDNAILDDMNGLEATELRLGLPGTSSSISKTKRPLDDQDTTPSCSDETAVVNPAAKSQVVGWPPVQAFRRNARRRHNHYNHECGKASSPATKEPPTTTPTSTPRPVQASSNPAALLVKVSMDGAPYLRKIDLGSYNGYKNLCLALDDMFRSSPHHQLTYEDKDGDWMLAGDVPWEMFAASCKRLKITKAISAANKTGLTEQLLSTDLTLAA